MTNIKPFIGRTSLPAIWINNEKKIIILTNHRVATISINRQCKDNSYEKIDDQYTLMNKYKNLGEYKFYMFVANPYSRMVSIYPGIMCFIKRDEIMNVNFFKKCMTEDERIKFQEKRRSSNQDDWNYCLDLFIKYYDKYYFENTAYEINEDHVKVKNSGFDGHITGQTHTMIYDISLLNRCEFIKLEELTAEKNKQILKKMFGTDKLYRCHKTRYYMDKNKYLTDKYIKFINEHYGNDFKLLGYDMI